MIAQSPIKTVLTNLPEGTVTFLFTDIEDSTQLLRHLREDYISLLADQRRILRETFADWQGYEVDTQGDSFFVAFGRATQAVNAAVAAQKKLKQHSWPGGVSLRIRMGIHTGEPWHAEEGYVGIVVHRAARIAHVAHGGQVLLSETTTALVQDDLPDGVSLSDAGRHLLKDIHRPEHINQLVIVGLQAEFPPLKSLQELPAEGTRIARKVGKSPYRGLCTFKEEDAPYYFGRGLFVDALEQAIRARKQVAVIVGSSGSGKSSALFAGLLPRLRKSGGYQFVTFRPGNQPFYALAGALLPLMESNLSKTDMLIETAKIAEQFQTQKLHLTQIVNQIKEYSTDPKQLLLVIDQFEELYTLCPDDKLQKDFVDELLASVAGVKDRKTAGLVILITLRVDFMGQALAHRPFVDTLQEASLLMGPMTREELRMAIEKPADMQGAAFEPGLVERILDDVGEKPGNLPLLEFTLTQLWEHQTDGWLTHSDYEAMGCVEGALAAYADQVYADLEVEERERARQALVQLVQPGEGTEDTRRIATREELGDERWQLIQHLADRRLVVTGRDAQGRETAEVVHETLIQKWGQFQAWMDSDRAFRAWQEQLRTHLRGWQESGQDEGALLRGAPLVVAQTWLGEQGEQVNPAEREYVDSSLALQERIRQENQRREQWMILLTSFALIQRQNAEQERQNAEHERQVALQQASILLARQAEVELANGYHDRAVLLALAALEEYPYTPQAEHALGQAVTYNRALAVYLGHTSAVTGADWSSDGKRIATISNDNSVHIWDATTGKLIRQINLPKGITGNIFDWGMTVKWSPDDQYLLTISGDRFLTGSQDYDLFLWDIETGEQAASSEVQNSIPPSTGELGTTGKHFMTGGGAAIASDGRIATLGGDNTALVWDSMLTKQQLVLSGHTEAINSLDWSPDFTMLVTASLDGTARIWDATSGQELMRLVGHTAGINQVAWSPDGDFIASGGKDGTVWIWDTKTGNVFSTIQMNRTLDSRQAYDLEIWSISWSSDEKFLATGGGDGYIRVWELESGKQTIELKGHDQVVTYLSWSPMGDCLVSTGADGRARIWNFKDDNMVLSLPYYSTTAKWSPDGKFIVAAASPDAENIHAGSVSVWNFETGKRLFETHADKDENWGWVLPLYSPDGENIIVRASLPWPDRTDANKYYMLNSQNGEIIRIFDTGKDTMLLIADISPDGKLFSVGDFEGTVYFWEVESGELVRTMDCLSWGHIIDWSPDGSKIAMLCLDFKKSLNAIRVLDAVTYDVLWTVEKDILVDTYQWISWSPDSTRIAVSGGNDEIGAMENPVYVFDASSGVELLKIVRHTGMVSGIGWSPDGKRLVSGSTDDTTRIWDVQTGVELLTISASVDWSLIPEWSPDGQYLLISILNMSGPGKSGVYRVWQTTEELINYAKECCVFRELTDAERIQYGLK